MDVRSLTIKNVIDTYIANGIDFYLHCDYNQVDYGPGNTIPPQMEDLEANIKISILLYRMNYKNYPTIIDNIVICTLIFGGAARTVRVPIESIYAVVCVNTEFGVSFPLIPEQNSQPVKQTSSKKNSQPVKQMTSKKNSRPNLRVVR